MLNTTGNTTREMLAREMHLRAETVNVEERSVEAVIATENRVTVMDLSRFEVIDEILLMDGVEVPRQIPLLENHQRESLDTHLGSIRNIRVDGRQLIGRLYLADTPQAEEAWQLVRQGHLTDVSTGNRALSAVMIEPGETQEVNGRQYTAGNRPLQITTRWTPREGSLTSIGADSAATVRKHPTMLNTTRTQREDITRDMASALCVRAGIPPQMVADAAQRERLEPYMADNLHRMARRCCELERVQTGATADEAVRSALSTAAFSDLLADLGEVAFTAERDRLTDTTDWAPRVLVENYRPTQRYQLKNTGRLQRRERGTPAASAGGGMTLDTGPEIKLVDYSEQFFADQQDLTDDESQAIRAGAEGLADAAIQTKADLIYSVLLANPDTPDGNSLFDSGTHDNDMSTALAKAAVGDAIEKIRTQQINGKPAGLEPRFLVVAPNLEETALDILRQLEVENRATLALRVEPRLQLGVTDPRDGTIHAGADSKWYVSAGRRGVEWATLEDAPGPQLNNWTKNGQQGMWGMGWAVRWALDAFATDYRGIVRGNS